MPHDMIDEYFEIYSNVVKEYGELVCVFFMVGSFFENYRVDNPNETIGNADKIAEIIRCDYSNKNKLKRSKDGSTRDFPDFCGFGTPYLPKYLQPLLENNYTVVIVEQLEDKNDSKGKMVKRGITAIHSPCLKPSDLENKFDTEYNLVNIMLEITNNIFIYSICSINNTTNDIEIYENIVSGSDNSNNLKNGLDDIDRVLLRYNIRDMQIHSNCDNKTIERHFNNYLNYGIKIKFNMYTYDHNNNQINEYYKRVYNHIDFGIISPVEFLNISDLYLSKLNFIYLLNYMSRHDQKYIKNLSLPKIIKNKDNLILELDTLSQLNILPDVCNTNKISSVFDIINHTKTLIGKRYLKNILSKPFNDINYINKRYKYIEELSKKEDVILNISKLLENILDFERLHRKMGLNELHPCEFQKLYFTYKDIKNIMNEIHINYGSLDFILSDDMLSQLDEYILDFENTFNLFEMNTKTNMLCKNFFKNGVIVDLDDMQLKIDNLESNMEELRLKYNNRVSELMGKNKSNVDDLVKLSYSENDNYFFTCTKLRYQLVLKGNTNTKTNNLKLLKTTGSICKFIDDDLIKLSLELVNTKNLLIKNLKIYFTLKTSDYYSKYYVLFNNLKEFIQILDVSLSNIKCSLRYNYCKPTIKNKGDSYIKCVKMRHPIIEIINNDSEYIPNDIELSNDNVGILLYGLNSSGKSSMLRSVGICIILAQAGLYVPCDTFEYIPFDTVISQVDLADNLFANKSSFINEMCGLRKILSCSNNKTLVLSDELCRGTEVNSSSAIVSSTILKLIKNNTKFFFTTHLHDLIKIEQIKNEKKLQIAHLSVNTNENCIIFERKLKPGSGSDLYGLEVCKSIIKDDDFIDIAFDIRNFLVNNKTSILSEKKSRYNSKKKVDCCQICNYRPINKNSLPLDTHHIQEQQNCNDLGFVIDKHYHKNRLFNLVILCKTCHQNIDTGKLIINGYKTGTSGTFLDYKLN